jgi:hypothetical protein
MEVKLGFMSCGLTRGILVQYDAQQVGREKGRI